MLNKKDKSKQTEKIIKYPDKKYILHLTVRVMADLE